MIGPGRAIGKPANIALHLSYDRRCAHCVPVPEHRNDLCRRATAKMPCLTTGKKQRSPLQLCVWQHLTYLGELGLRPNQNIPK